MSEESRTICRMCHGGCGVLVATEGDRVVSLRGDPSNQNNRGFLCAKGAAAMDHLYHPDRLRSPLRRIGGKGDGRFVPITWEDAYAEIAASMERLRDAPGPESVVFAQGTDRNYQEWLFRFANAFGSPNVLGPAHVCFYPRVMAGILSMGAFTFCDYEGTPACLVIWGSNKILTHGDGVIGTRLLAALRRGTQLIVVDPRRTELAQRARYWLQIRPGTDAALALGMIHVIIEARRHDADFVARHTVGFAELAAHVARYRPEVVAEITSVPAGLIREAALFYADAASAAIEAGTGVEQNQNALSTTRALCILAAICGNIDRPGGDVIWEPSGLLGRRAFPNTQRLPPAQQAKRLIGEHRILGMAGWAHPGAVWSAILEERPYPVRMMLVFGSNLLVNYACSSRVYAALQRLEHLVVCDLFLTPTARMADLVLPVSGWLERAQIVEHAHYVAARQQLAQIGDCRSDEQILNDLARRLGLGAHFFPSVEASLDQRLAPLGQTWEGLQRLHYLPNQLRYHKYRDAGFPTRSGKFNITSGLLASLGYDALPTYRALPRGRGAYILTSARSRYFFNSEFRNIERLRCREPEPVVELHPDAAAREDLREGDWAWVRTEAGEARFRVRFNDGLAPDVVYVSALWWYPELSFPESWRRSNVNLLTSEESEGDEMGSSNFRGVTCLVERAL